MLELHHRVDKPSLRSYLLRKEYQVKLSCPPVSFFPQILDGRMSVREWAEMARDLGLDGFDVGMTLITSHTRTYLRRLRNEIRDVGLGITMITDYPDFTPLSRVMIGESTFSRRPVRGT